MNNIFNIRSVGFVDTDTITFDYNIKRPPNILSLIAATNKKIHDNEHVAEDIPSTSQTSGKLIFHRPRKHFRGTDLSKFFMEKDLILADPCTLWLFNEAKPDFANRRQNATQWTTNNKDCCLAFGVLNSESYIFLSDNTAIWNDSWWFACFQKSDLDT